MDCGVGDDVCDSASRCRHEDDAARFSPDHTIVGRLKLDDTGEGPDYAYLPSLLPDPNPVSSATLLGSESDRVLLEDYDFSDVDLKYIIEMLMEEDMEEKACMFQESMIQAAEKSFYEVIGEKYPPSPDHSTLSRTDSSRDSCADVSCSDSRSFNDRYLVDPGWNCDMGEHRVSITTSSSSSCTSVSSSSSSAGTAIEGFADLPVSILRLTEVFSKKKLALHFKKGVEEASKFLPDDRPLFADMGKNDLSFDMQERDSTVVVPKLEDLKKKEYYSDKSRGKKNPLSEDEGLAESRSHKQSAVSTESSVSPEMFDMVLLNCGKGESQLREALQSIQQNGQSKGSNRAKGRGKKQGRKKDAVDLRTLLTLCAQAVAVNDRRSANEMLKQIRQHASPLGDGMQRMAHYFADGLEARLAGSGTDIYNALMCKPTSAASVLKAYHLLLAACPFRKISNFFSNKTIMNVAEWAPKLHIIDFGILYGFQWPCLIQLLSSRHGGPPNLRITGIDLPQPGFRPADRVEETGRRLANYAKTFGVPFEFNAIAQRWDTIQLEDLKIDEDEVLVVNCMYRLRNLLDETVVAESPRDIVLNLIRNMKPDVMILGIVNGAYSAPFFITRFREALFHYSTIFDMLETNVPRDIPERMLIEKEIFGWEAMNVIACEGSERIERPETYKQCQVRNMRAGLTPLPLDEEIMEAAKNRVRSYYHKDFLIDRDGPWLLQGWKGRIVYGLSTWRPAP